MGQLGKSPGASAWQLPNPLSIGTTPPERRTIARKQYDLDMVRLNAFRVVWALVLQRVLPSVIECAGEVVVNVRGPLGWLSVTIGARDVTISGSTRAPTIHPPEIDDELAQNLAMFIIDTTGVGPYSIPHDAPWIDLVTSAAERDTVGRDQERP